ncbi:hypothetical protein ACFSCX_22435 [Bacillus salitolerans]|uniref:Uncharacterized protein n=1 Tax=Bacillus salitolerans TaxID=1437434 RepID=A0ABW4LXU2_9BACI
MRLHDLVEKINKSMAELDLITARVYIQENLQVLTENRSLLNSNARELLSFLSSVKDTPSQPLNRVQLATIQSVNAFASKFDVRGIKVTLKDHTDLFLRKDIHTYLNADARALLASMGAISKN